MNSHSIQILTRGKMKPERIIVDDKGNRLKPRNTELRQWREKSKIRHNGLTALNPTPTSKDLDRLEDAIFNHGEPYRTEFLNMCNPIKDLIPQTFIDYLTELPSHRRRTLLYCWQIRKWRPDSSCNRVLDGTKNPYLK